MIIFQAPDWQYDLTDHNIGFNEPNDYFSDKITKNVSFPFNVKLHEELAEKLGLVNIDNVSSYKSKIYGYLIMDRNFYDAYIAINEIKGDKAELTLFYGKETLKVFDKKLSDLPFPVINALSGLPAFAKSQITKSWPEATHNFVKVFRPGLKQNSNYEYFEKFVNNYINTAGTWAFPENTIDVIDGQNVSVNRNIMCPFPYLMEILRVGFASEGLELKGDFVNDTLNQKIIHIPKNFFEQLAVSQFENYSFTTQTSQTTVNGQTINVYQHIHTPTNEGSFTIKFKINLSDAMAKYFKLTIVQNNVTLYEAFSQNNEVIIDKTVDINIVNTTVFNDIVVKLELTAQNVSIANFNSFSYEYKEGQLNVFPSAYSLSSFMPNIIFRELINRLKSWKNLKFDYTNNAVYINYLETALGQFNFNDISHLQSPEPTRLLNKNNLFKLTYPNGDKVLVNKNGQTYSESEFVDEEIEQMEIKVLPLSVKSNNDTITAVYPEDEEDLMFCLYNGPVNDDNLATDNILNRKLDLQHIYNENWKRWLKFRANSESYKTSFYMHITEDLNIKEGVFKHNKNHLITNVLKKRVHDEYWKIDLETETF
jgi:hypothetical protein